MNDPQPIDARRRIRELLSVPERDRTDEQWDELNELEIQTAPGNRDTGRDMGKPQDRYQERRPQGAGGQQPRRQDRNNQAPRNNNNNNNAPRPEARPPQEGVKQEARPPKRQHRRPKRPVGENVEKVGDKPAGSGGDGGNGSAPAA